MSSDPVSTLASTPGAVMKIGCAMMGSGQGDKAVAMVRAMLARRPDDCELASAARVILSHGVPAWHGRMLADAQRNAAFARAIGAAVRGGGRVLDIGAGSGLLSLMAARGGADRVIACEADPALAATARTIIEANGYADRVSVVAGRSTDLDPAELGGPADVVVAETFSDDLVNEGALATFEHAVTTLARPSAQVIPAAASVRIALAYLLIDEPDLADVEGFDLRPFAAHLPPDRKVAVDHARLQLRGEPATLFRFDLTAPRQPRHDRAEVRLTAEGGPANGVVRWIRLQLDATEQYENAPGTGRRSHWAALFTPLGRVVEAGAEVVVHAAHDRERVQLWFDLP